MFLSDILKSHFKYIVYKLGPNFSHSLSPTKKNLAYFLENCDRIFPQINLSLTTYTYIHAYSHNILTEWDKSSLRGSSCKWSLVFSVKMPPNMIWNTKYHLWHLFPLGIWISLLRKLLPSCCCCWEAVGREEGQWRTISISAHVRQTADHTNKCSDQKRFFNGLLG